MKGLLDSIAVMGMFLPRGLITVCLILSSSLRVCAETPPGEPIFARADNSVDLTYIQQLIQDHPKIIDRLKTLIEQNPRLVASIAKDSIELIQAIQNYPQLTDAIIDANPQLIQALMNNPQSRAILMQ